MSLYGLNFSVLVLSLMIEIQVHADLILMYVNTYEPPPVHDGPMSKTNNEAQK